MRFYKAHFIFWTAPLLLLGACAAVPDRDMSAAASLDVPYKAAKDAESAPDLALTPQKKPQLRWWEHYESTALNQLMNRAFSNSPTIAQIRSRLEQARALSQQSKAGLLPSADMSAERGTTRGDNKTPSDYTVSGAAQYEIDFWQKNRAQAKADTLLENATYEDLLAAHITLSANIVQRWLEVLSLKEQEALVRKQIDINRMVLDLQAKRFEMGTSTALDYLQQQEILAQSEAALPDIIAARKQSMNDLALLLGETPQNTSSLETDTMSAPLPLPNSGLPSDLLSQRPDILAAWFRLLSADWAAQAAWANRLPSFTLSAAYSTSATSIANLFNVWILDLAASVSAPLFDGGARKYEQIRQEALADERYHAYRETVLSAINDVENALVANHQQDKKIKALEKQLTASRATLERAQISYANGSADYINVLNSLNNTQSLEQRLLSQKLTQAKARVSLHRALGGRSWASALALAPDRQQDIEHPSEEAHMQAPSNHENEPMTQDHTL